MTALILVLFALLMMPLPAILAAGDPVASGAKVSQTRSMPMLRPSVRPNDVVPLRQMAPSIVQDIRYAGSHNFVGRPLPGYEQAECWLTQAAASRLASVQLQLKRQGYSLKVYDCYRPQRAVDAFIAWSGRVDDTLTKAEFYPTVNKRDVFKLGYVAKRSGHSRASTVDLTLVALPVKAEPAFNPREQHACYLPVSQRYADNSIDMGTGYDCFHAHSAPTATAINSTAKHNRALLQDVMLAHGFVQSSTEWWHFTLTHEPYPNQYFDFPVVAGHNA